METIPINTLPRAKWNNWNNAVRPVSTVRPLPVPEQQWGGPHRLYNKERSGTLPGGDSAVDAHQRLQFKYERLVCAADSPKNAGANNGTAMI